MTSRIIIRLGTWTVGAILFIGASVEVTRLFGWLMQRWAVWHGTSRGFAFELRIFSLPVFALCLIAGAIYASALARPSLFGGLPRIWRHLIATYLFFLLASALFLRAEFLPLPDFSHSFELNAYLFVLLSLPVICLAVGIFAWARLAFGGKIMKREGNFTNTNPNC